MYTFNNLLLSVILQLQVKTKYSNSVLLFITIFISAGANIFLTEEGNTLKLGDFGCAVRLRGHQTEVGELAGIVGTHGESNRKAPYSVIP